jgi:hypothetical protein
MGKIHYPKSSKLNEVKNMLLPRNLPCSGLAIKAKIEQEKNHYRYGAERKKRMSVQWLDYLGLRLWL